MASLVRHVGGGEAEGAPEAPLRPLSHLSSIHFQVNIKYGRRLGSISMKEIDDTPLPKTESEAPEWFLMWIATYFSERLNSIERRIAELETQRVANESNQDDPDWY